MPYHISRVLSCLLSLGVTAFGQERYPRFKDYQARVVAMRRTVRVNIHSTPDTVCFRTMLRKAARDGQRFAGHYVVGYWGCGTCVRIGIVDLITGRSYVTSFGITPDGAADNVVKAKPGSRLLMVANSEAPGGYLYFLWTGRKLLPIYDGKVELREPARNFYPC